MSHQRLALSPYMAKHRRARELCQETYRSAKNTISAMRVCELGTNTPVSVGLSNHGEILFIERLSVILVPDRAVLLPSAG